MNFIKQIKQTMRNNGSEIDTIQYISKQAKKNKFYLVSTPLYFL